MDTRHGISTLCLLLVLAAAQLSSPALAAPIDSSIPKEAADAIEAADWEKVSAILKPLADANEVTEPMHFWYGVANFHQEKFTTDDTAMHLKAALEANPTSSITAKKVTPSTRPTIAGPSERYNRNSPPTARSISGS